MELHHWRRDVLGSLACLAVRVPDLPAFVRQPKSGANACLLLTSEVTDVNYDEPAPSFCGVTNATTSAANHVPGRGQPRSVSTNTVLKIQNSNGKYLRMVDERKSMARAYPVQVPARPEMGRITWFVFKCTC